MFGRQLRFWNESETVALDEHEGHSRVVTFFRGLDDELIGALVLLFLLFDITARTYTPSGETGEH